MKKLIFIFSATIFALNAMAQDVKKDIIYKTNYEILEVKIIEVSSTEVRYKALDNVEGPTFILSASEIGKIKFCNGEEKMYTVNGKSVTNIAQNASRSLPSSLYITRTGQRYMYDGKIMKGSAYATFLKENCSAAYMQYDRGYSISKIGWGFFCTGLFLDLGSIFAAATSANKITISILSLAGGAFEIASIPTLIVGYNNMHRSADTFNMTCRQQSQAYWSINASQNSIGLALHF